MPFSLSRASVVEFSTESVQQARQRSPPMRVGLPQLRYNIHLLALQPIWWLAAVRSSPARLPHGASSASSGLCCAMCAVGLVALVFQYRDGGGL